MSPQSMPRSSEESTDHTTKFSGRHRVFDLAALGDIERAVMQRDGQPIIIHAPEILEQHFRLAAGVDEHQRGLVALISSYISPSACARNAPPTAGALGVEHLDHGRRRAAGDDDIGGFISCGRVAAPETAAANPARRPLPTSRCRASRAPNAIAAPAQRKQIAALGGDQRVQFVEHDALQRAEQERRVVGGQQQRELLGRGQQDIRRIAPLPLRRDTGVSPVRVSTLIGSPISAIGVSRLRAMSTASAFSGER